MQSFFRFALLSFVLMAFAPFCTAQDALDRLEQRLGEEDAAGAEEAAPGPRAAVEPGYLGAVADDRQDRGRGVRIVEVIQDGPAAAAGLRTDDLITAIDGRPVRGMTDLSRALRRTPAGGMLKLEILRGDASLAVDVTLGQRPQANERRFREFGPIPEDGEPAEPAPAAPRAPGLGITARGVDEEARRRLQLPAARGALVAALAPGSPAERAGIPLDAVIVAADGQPIHRPADLANLVRRGQAGQSVEFSYLFQGDLLTTTVTLTAPAEDGPLLPAPESSDDSAARIEALERRILELEQRLEALEAAARAGN